MAKQPLPALCDIATEAHTRIQQQFADIDPIVGVSQNMRATGVPADVMTIDCLKSSKRILLILHDQQPGLINYQFGFIEKEPLRKFEQLAFDQLTATMLFGWIKDYFQAT